MSKWKNWPAQKLESFLKDYGFKRDYCKRSGHRFYNGKIKGKGRIVQVVYSHKEKKGQSDATMDLAVKHSGISKEYFQEWNNKKNVHSEIVG